MKFTVSNGPYKIPLELIRQMAEYQEAAKMMTKYNGYSRGGTYFHCKMTVTKLDKNGRKTRYTTTCKRRIKIGSPAKMARHLRKVHGNA